MAVRPRQSAQGLTAATAAGLALVALLSTPVLAAPERDVLSDDNELTLDVSALEFSATPVNSSEELLNNHLLRPRTEAALRSAFADDVDETEEVETEGLEEEVEASDETPVVPSAFGREPSPYKRQMYRRDI